ncbi:hypothetical protein BDV95DRAFT_611267 [Massariosphaeria phaeospora]|uniref:Uncharacterized protein n=1 Tax=Massariosphaeria phaeospora TaxID=100035 RepID=A0A7C8M404_9PLEO|nr:hypothetical protein BDV95DRAFT_611267 [Massariosphaeria phaeospora]
MDFGRYSSDVSPLVRSWTHYSAGPGKSLLPEEGDFIVAVDFSTTSSSVAIVNLDEIQGRSKGRAKPQLYEKTHDIINFECDDTGISSNQIPTEIWYPKESVRSEMVEQQSSTKMQVICMDFKFTGRSECLQILMIQATITYLIKDKRITRDGDVLRDYITVLVAHIKRQMKLFYGYSE